MLRQHMPAAAAERRKGTRGLGVAVEWRCVRRVRRVQSPEGTATSVRGLKLLVYEALSY